MKTIFDKNIRNELTNRINTINKNKTAQWGKMNIYQMVKHCILWNEMAQGKRKYKRNLIGYLFGKRALDDFIKDDSPIPQNVPSLSQLKITENSGDLENTKVNFAKSIEDYENFTNFDFVHPFFGKINKEQIGILAYKHTDHHLRQFNC